MTAFYGLVKPAHIFDVVSVVCDVLGHGNNNCASNLLLETAAQETHCGLFRDPTPNGAGRGLFQCDPIAFKDVQMRARQDDVLAVVKEFNFDLRYLPHASLDVSPLAAAVFARLHYKRRTEEIPSKLEGRAVYWKQFYNTKAGDGRVEQYISNSAIIKQIRVSSAANSK